MVEEVERNHSRKLQGGDNLKKEREGKKQEADNFQMGERGGE